MILLVVMWYLKCYCFHYLLMLSNNTIVNSYLLSVHYIEIFVSGSDQLTKWKIFQLAIGVLNIPDFQNYIL